MAFHTLKTERDVFQAVKLGIKEFEYRKDDRGFEVGDVLQLCEYDPKTGESTGDMIMRAVSYILRGPRFGVPAGYVVMQIRMY